MIYLITGAVLDKELEITDYTDGRRFGPRLGWLSTFNPCQFCSNSKCRKNQYGPCDDAYLELWKKKYLEQGAQAQLEQWGMEA
ncbi:MAG: hypothetical protein E7Z65_06240 [Thermoplasmata archaeon]|nr:hypothetical protein [Thermoplasmata archaeon]